MKNKNGFTLIEIVVAMVITGILACIAVPSYTNYITQGEISSAQNTLMVIKVLQQSYYFNNGQYCLSGTKCADNTTDINTNLKINITDNYYNYTCNVCNAPYAYCCTATNISNGSVVSTIPSGQSACGGVSSSTNNSSTNNGSNPTVPVSTPVIPVIPSPINCVGSWNICSNGIQTYTIITPSSNGGSNCPYLSGNTQSCGVPCVTGWTTCSKSCGGGTQSFEIITPASGGGTVCSIPSHSVESCNTQVCPVPVNCVGSWGSCSETCGTGTETYTVTTPASNGGTVCSYANGLTQDCSNACGKGQMCNSNNQCVTSSTSKTCVPSCAGKACMTSDGCGGEC